MLRSYFQIGIINLLKRKFCTLLNLLGLVVGFMACTVMIFLDRNELNLTRFYQKNQLAVRAWNEKVIAGPFISGQGDGGEYLKIEDHTILQQTSISIKRGTSVFKESNAFLVDPSFFESFKLPLTGNHKMYLIGDFNPIIMTPSSARKYFGPGDPIGQILEVSLRGEGKSYTVAGVVNPPAGPGIKFDFLIPFHLLIKQPDIPDYTHQYTTTK